MGNSFKSEHEPVTLETAKLCLLRWTHDVNRTDNREAFEELLEVCRINTELAQERGAGAPRQSAAQGQPPASGRPELDYVKLADFRGKYEELGLLKQTAVDQHKLFAALTDPADYVGRQLGLETRQAKLLAKKELSEAQQKGLFRLGIPDSHKREKILSLFRIAPHQCDFDYNAIKRQVERDFLKYTEEIKQVCEGLPFDILTAYGKNELEFILMYMHCKHSVKRVRILGHIGSLLLMHITPAELYCLFQNMLRATGKAKKNEEGTRRMRWHIPQDEGDQGQLISSFLDCYIRMYGEKQSENVMSHFMKVGVNFDILLHSLFNTALQSVLTLDDSLHVTMLFLLEGQKLLFRLTFAVLKLNHDFLMTVTSKKDLVKRLRENHQKKVTLDSLLTCAFELPLVTTASRFGTRIEYAGNAPDKISQKLEMSRPVHTPAAGHGDGESRTVAAGSSLKASDLGYFTNKTVHHTFERVIGNIEEEYKDKVMKLPSFRLDSAALSFKQSCDLWSAFPTYVQIRKPEKVFESAVNGYNIDTMYARCLEFLEEEGEGVYDAYHCCLLVVRTAAGDVFGAFVTSVPVATMRFTFRGTFGSFVFRLAADGVVTFKTEEEVNKYYMQCAFDSLSVGQGGDGPAIYLDKELFKGVSNACETYGSPVLLEGGAKHTHDMFEAKNFEVFIL